MKILLDENVAINLKTELIKCGFEDVVHIDDIEKGMKDSEVYELAKEEERIIISFDNHFKAKKLELYKGAIFITASARKLDDLPGKIKWIIDNISNYNIDISTASIRLTFEGYNIFYKKGMEKKDTTKTILYSKIKHKRNKVKI